MPDCAWTYLHPADVAVVDVAGRPSWRTPEGGLVASDDRLIDFWRSADGCSLLQLLGLSPFDEQLTRAAAACLAEAGLLVRSGAAPRALGQLHPGGDRRSLVDPHRVSVIVVNYRTDEWLEACVDSIRRQTIGPPEIVIVDNGSPDDPTTWIAERFPDAIYIRLDRSRSLAGALAVGAARASGGYFCFLNPDVVLADDAIERLVRRAQSTERCAAVAAKMRFLWAPAFLNGIGNRVNDSSWGTDNWIGHLDLGQFDRTVEVPSACLAAALIPRLCWADVGPFDDEFPLYYEDVEWCYRARLLGYTVAAAPDAQVYHAFGSKVPTGEPEPLPPRKLSQAAYGRLRFVLKLLAGPVRRRFLTHYTTEDRSNFWQAVRTSDWPVARAYLRAWAAVGRDLPSLTAANRRLRARASGSLDDVFDRQRSFAPGLVWRGLPELSLAHVQSVYLPVFTAGATRPVPEFSRI